MKIILSRKGFDSENGGIASPILPDGTLLSLPIPQQGDNCRFEELRYNGHTYSEIIAMLGGRGGDGTCHLDPDIRKGIRREPVGWKPALGQTETSLTHLNNQKIQIGDLFLFFGWFIQTEIVNGVLKFKKEAPNLHVIYGYLQIGDIITDTEEIRKSFPWHPHAHYSDAHIGALFIPSEKLTINGKVIAENGYGTLHFSEKGVLTQQNCPRTRWKRKPWFSTMSYSSQDKPDKHPEYFQSAYKGQEFVIPDSNCTESGASAEAIEWAVEIIKQGL